MWMLAMAAGALAPFAANLGLAEFLRRNRDRSEDR
jgi:hypothetical protein